MFKNKMLLAGKLAMEAVCKAALSRHRVEPSYHRTCCKNTVINEVFQKIQGPKREPKWNLRVGDNSASSGNNNHTPWRSGPGSGLKCVRCNAIADKMVNNFLLQST